MTKTSSSMDIKFCSDPFALTLLLSRSLILLEYHKRTSIFVLYVFKQLTLLNLKGFDRAVKVPEVLVLEWLGLSEKCSFEECLYHIFYYQDLSSNSFSAI